jgi:hypothetical protein
MFISLAASTTGSQRPPCLRGKLANFTFITIPIVDVLIVPKSVCLYCCSNDEFYTIIDLPQGDHHYRFLVDGQWMCDPNGVCLYVCPCFVY